MARYVEDDYELPDDDELPYEGKIFRRRQRRAPAVPFVFAAALVMGLAAVASFFFVNDQQASDAFCVSCHTPQHQAYLDRATASLGGALAPDLSSFHYQQIRGNGGDIRCIDCHRGDDTTRHRLETFVLSASMSARWLAGTDDRSLEKTTLTSTVISGITQTMPQTALALRQPQLTNEGCVGCHTEQLLVAGADNHVHTMLPAVYDAWKAGARLIPPRGATDTDRQAIVAQGLMRYDTTLQCHNCHQAHRVLDTVDYLDRQGVVKPACEQCHRQTGLGPAEVTIAEEE